jgi:hypothetical protein
MAIYGGITQSNVSTGAQARLMALRLALEAAADFYAWLSAYSSADLVAIGFTQADADALLTAFADANELAVLYNGGDLGTYTLPYNFSASQRKIIGPQF